MDCHSNHSVFVRANGSLTCWCDAGSKLTLKTFDPDIDYSKDVVFGEVFTRIRDKLKSGEMPFPSYCRDCLTFASGARFNSEWEEKKKISTFQVEASIACILECPGCLTFAERKKIHGRPWHLEIGILEKYLSDFQADGVSIDKIDFQGHGEPILNKDIWKMAGLAKSYFPEACVSMCTSAHSTYDPSQVHSGMDEIIFAIDGIDQESFEQNRVRGNFDKAYTFMRSFCQGAIRENRTIRTVWKYILFDCNNSPEQLIKAQHLAAEAGVQELHFVNTQLGPKSSKVYALDEIPNANTGVQVSISGYLSNFDDILHAVDKARYAISQDKPGAAQSNLLFAANMMRRRFDSIRSHEALPEDYQALAYEVLQLCEASLIKVSTRSMVKANLHRIEGKLDMPVLSAKDLVIKWKSEEILRLTEQVHKKGFRGTLAVMRAKLKGHLQALSHVLGPKSLDRRDRIIAQKSKQVLNLAIRLEQQS